MAAKKWAKVTNSSLKEAAHKLTIRQHHDSNFKVMYFK